MRTYSFNLQVFIIELKFVKTFVDYSWTTDIETSIKLVNGICFLYTFLL